MVEDHGESPKVVEKKEYSFLTIVVPAGVGHLGSRGFCGGND
jgi:hypothetical protein